MFGLAGPEVGPVQGAVVDRLRLSEPARSAMVLAYSPSYNLAARNLSSSLFTDRPRWIDVGRAGHSQLRPCVTGDVVDGGTVCHPEIRSRRGSGGVLNENFGSKEG